MITSSLALRHITKLPHAGRLHAGVSFVLQHEAFTFLRNQKLSLAFQLTKCANFSKVLMGLKEMKIRLYSG
jgi:hypothetical protein